MSVFLRDGRLHSPYFIWLRCEGELTDAELLEAFGLGDYRPAFSGIGAGLLDRCAVIADDGEWTLLADDWYYTLWHANTTRPMLAELAARFDVFACSIGEQDDSFDFIYYRAGQLVRHYVLHDSWYVSEEVQMNAGTPFAHEAEALQLRGTLDKVMALATGLGIKTTFAQHELLLYAPLGDVLQPVTEKNE